MAAYQNMMLTTVFALLSLLHFVSGLDAVQPASLQQFDQRSDELRANETEVLAYQTWQAAASLPKLQQFLQEQVKNNVHVKAVPNIFAQQSNVSPPDGSLQLENFGALIEWENILNLLDESPNYRLLILVRHGQAWENLNPTPNSNCEFLLNGEIIQNIDSPLSPEGVRQVQALNDLFNNPASSETNLTWFETVGLKRKTSSYLTSPLSRTMQTTQGVFDKLLPLSEEGTSGTEAGFVVHELLRASMGQDVCNFRRSVNTSTSSTVLPFPWQTGCTIPTDSLQSIYGNASAPKVKFSFPIRPAGGSGFGLVSDYDQQWRADVEEGNVIDTRASAFLSQVRDYTEPSSVIAVVTHGEMIQAIYQAAGEVAYGAKNTEVVPLLLKFN